LFKNDLFSGIDIIEIFIKNISPGNITETVFGEQRNKPGEWLNSGGQSDK
jgi:hypothetical protein